MIIGVPKEIKQTKTGWQSRLPVSKPLSRQDKVFIEKTQGWAAVLPMKSISRPGLLCWTLQKKYMKRPT